MQFVGKVITSVSEFYKDINPSTLSGAIDVLVIEDVVTGQLHCSPFHVRFGKLALLRPQEKVVQLQINGKPVDLQMKVGEAGETFFVLEYEEGEILGEGEAATSPLVKPLAEGREVEPLSLSSPQKDNQNTNHNGQGHRRVDSDPELDAPLKGSTRNSGALSDSELEFAESKKKDTLPLPLSVGSPPRYSWMWGGLPQRASQSETPKSREETEQPGQRRQSRHDDEEEVKALTKVLKDITLDPESLEERALNTSLPPSVPSSPASSDAEAEAEAEAEVEETTSVVEKSETTSVPGGADIKDTSKTSPLMLDIFEYVNKPIIFKRNYEAFKSIPEGALVNYNILRPRGDTEPSVFIDIDETDISRIINSPVAESSLIRMEWTTFAEDPTAALSDLGTKKTLILVNVASEGTNPSLVKLGCIFSGGVGQSLILGRTLFNQVVPLETLLKKYPFLDENAAAVPKRSSWRWWTRANSTASKDGLGGNKRGTVEAALRKKSVDLDHESVLSTEMQQLSSPPPIQSRPGQHYKKSLRLSDEMLKRLNLLPGLNTISYTVTTRLQGTSTCSARIFRWRSDHRLIISDVDGTITKSDALGHLFAMVGRDWTHLDIARLYSKIAANGYHFVYLTSRSLGQANSTRGYLRGVEQNGRFQLPDGPVIMSPDRLLAALRREVVLGTPQEFKIACLRDLQQLFYNCTPLPNYYHAPLASDHRPEEEQHPPLKQESSTSTPTSQPPTAPANPSISPLHPNPFYAGFGNRSNDAHAYTEIGIPPPRIFIVNPSGTVAVEPLYDHYSGSYTQLIDLVDQMFPPLRSKDMPIAEETFNDFWYWRRPTSMALAPVNPDGSPPHSFGSQFDLHTEEEEEEEEEEEGLVPAYYV